MGRNFEVEKPLSPHLNHMNYHGGIYKLYDLWLLCKDLFQS